MNEFLKRPGAALTLAFVLSFWRRRSQRPQETLLGTVKVGIAVGGARAFASWIQNRPGEV